MTPFARQRIAFALALLSSKPCQVTIQEYFRLLRSQIKEGFVKEASHFDTLGLLKERIARLEVEQVALQSTSISDKRTIKDLEDELHRLKDGQDSQTTGSNRKRKRMTKDTAFKFPSFDAQKTFGVFALPALFHSIQVLLSPDTTSEQIVLSAHTLAISLITHFKELTMMVKSPLHSFPSPAYATHSLFALLTTQYTSSKLSSTQQPVVAEIIMDLVVGFLSIIDECCGTLVKSAIYDDPCPKDYRETLTQGILGICSATPLDSPLRQALLLALLGEFKRIRCEKREGRVAILAKDESLWYICYLIEEVVGRTGFVGKLIEMDVQRLIWESISVAGEEGMTKGNWIAWKVCGLLGGVGCLTVPES